MFCPNCGTRIDNGLMCPNCGCNGSYSIAKVNEWENYIKAAEEYAEKTNIKPTYKFNLAVFIPCVIAYIGFIGYLLFGLLLGGKAFSSGIEKFYYNLESNGFEEVSDKKYEYNNENVKLIIDIGEGYFAGKDENSVEYYYYYKNTFEYTENDDKYDLYITYKYNDKDYSCFTVSSAYQYKCTEYKEDAIEEADTIKKTLDTLLSNSGMTLEELVGEMND